MTDTLKIITPLQKRVLNIREELFERTVYKAGNESLPYGKFDKAFKKFKVESFRNGLIVDKIDFIKNRIEELNKLALSISPLQERIFKETNNKIIFHSILYNISDVIEIANSFITNKVEEPTKIKTVRKTNNKTTYEFLYDKGKLNVLFKALQTYDLISKENKYTDFDYIFSNKPLSNVKPLIWGSDTSTELLFFVIEMIENELISGKGKNMDYKKMTSCFKTINNEAFNAQFRQIKKNIELNLSLEKQKLITKIILTSIK